MAVQVSGSKQLEAFDPAGLGQPQRPPAEAAAAPIVEPSPIGAPEEGGQEVPAGSDACGTAPMRVLTLLDASGYIFRAYHALPGLTTSKGVPTNAVLGFTRMLLKTLRELNPTHVALAFDNDSRRGRLAIDPSYKANREAPAEDLVTQFSLIRKVADALNVPIVEVPGWEADDVIATLAARAKREGFEVLVITSDKDFIQLISDHVTLFDPVGERRIGRAEAREKYGIDPTQMRDYLALVGDAIDNVAKVPGIGPKTAVELLHQFGDVDALLARVSEVKKPKIRESLLANVESLRRARELVTFRADLEIDVRLDSLARRPIHERETRALFSELEFFKLIQEMPAAAPTPLNTATEVVCTAEGLGALAVQIRSAGSVTLVPAADGPAVTGALAGLAVGLPDGRLFYVPIAHEGAAQQPPPDALQRALGPCLADPAVRKTGHDLKRCSHALAAAGLPLAGLETDVELLSYLLNPSRREHALSDLARERLKAELPALAAPANRRKGERIGALPVEDAARAFGAAVDAARRLAPGLWEEAERVGLATLARELELPLLPVLARMERAGIKVDREVLAQVGAKVDAACQTHLTAIYAHAGHEFNVGSPLQLAKVLYGELNLPVLKRGKTGPSTDQEVLEKLAEQHPLPSAILEYRNVAKLKSTYLDTLPALIAADGRVHTTFHQAAAATGRLSSSDPNLQNIPIRTELGREVRRAFVAEPGHLLISADYSQVELRILAHIAGDAALVDAFRNDADVHTRTAAEVFGVGPEQVSSEQRRAAKMVNYGIAYGLSPHGLSSRLGIPTEEAKAIIDRYFERYAGIRRYLDETVERARRSGFVETLFGRRRYMPELGSRNRSMVMAAERAAINMPIQGTAADLIKKAMLRIDQELGDRRLSARMLLQVHDELVFEASEAEAPAVRELALELMSSVASFSVPLKVDVGVGRSWADAH